MTIEYWKGVMDWPRDNNWKCETCGGSPVLIWGFIHAECRCSYCHTQYSMRDKNQKVVTTPICLLKPEYKEPAKLLWRNFSIPVDEATDKQWDKCFAEVTQ